MTSPTARAPRPVRSAVLALPRAVTRLRTSPPPERRALPVLVAMSLLTIPGTATLGIALVPPAMQVVPLLGGALLLRRRPMRWLLLAVAIALAYDLAFQGLMQSRPGTLLVVLLTAVVAYEFARSRDETGLAGATGDTLLLSGALGGLLGSLRPEEFLPAANRYLDRQDWDEGFATAVHLVLDTDTGEYVVESAGHPPVAHFDAGSGRWSLLDAEGFALGLVPDVTYVPVTGRLDRGDALLLYTDGLVEIPGRDLAVGIDKLLGEAERLVTQGFEGGADLLVRRVAGAANDDRGLVLLWRER